MKEQLEKLRQEATDSIAKINEALEALKNEKPKFEVGKWYKDTTSPILINILDIGDGFEAFGFNGSGEWKDGDTFYGGRMYAAEKELILADPKEVEEHLIAEAKKKYKNGDVILSPITFQKIATNGEFKYLVDNDSIVCSHVTLYQKGVWSEVIKEDKIFLDKEQKYEIEFKDNAVVINNVFYGKDSLNQVKKVLNLGQIKSLNVGCNGQYKVDLELINKILEKLK